MTNITAINYQALREAAEEEIMLRTASDTSDNWQDLATPEAMLALLDEREAKDKAWSAQDNHINQQAERIESLEKKNGELGRELESAEKRIAELKKQCAEWERKALSNFEECAAMAERIEELEQATTGQDANVNSQQERVAQSANRHVYHYNAVSNVSGITMSGIAQSPFRIKSQSDLEEFKSALSKVCGFHATAVTSLSYLGREEEE
ncbi:TPA: ead/Ea22-like family protein [Escherichia coli]|nr:ead/Ea22-like family protein [Escherichia coli]EFX6135228.1 ead/Ea22-like family protein [Shigella boydii]EFF9401641.1 ead/Ea22-like family protein [Escherichia coli]EFY0418101.1 ead/Ea22-like family protein [Shigella boydii]MDO2866877.1 ead/Ea22-like family protein [Escherichia coli]MEC6239310.1 ead/Ea22-like family protein [Escherichia coli]